VVFVALRRRGRKELNALGYKQRSHRGLAPESQTWPALVVLAQESRLSGHDMLGQAMALLQSTSQLHAATQSMDGHDDCPEHPTLHSVNPQSIAPHDREPEQLMSHLVPRMQSMLPHALALLHSIVQSYPSGHWTLPHGLAALHSILQVRLSGSQDVHGLGQSLTRSTQYPRSQVRLSWQSALVSHASASERRLTVQLVADIAPIPRSASAKTMAGLFIKDLPGW
jgi:hypothetical protein